MAADDAQFELPVGDPLSQRVAFVLVESGAGGSHSLGHSGLVREGAGQVPDDLGGADDAFDPLLWVAREQRAKDERTSGVGQDPEPPVRCEVLELELADRPGCARRQ